MMHGHKNIMKESMFIIIFGWNSIILYLTWVLFSFIEVSKLTLLPHTVPLSARREGIISSKCLAWNQLLFSISDAHFCSPHLLFLV